MCRSAIRPSATISWRISSPFAAKGSQASAERPYSHDERNMAQGKENRGNGKPLPIRQRDVRVSLQQPRGRRTPREHGEHRVPAMGQRQRSLGGGGPGARAAGGGGPRPGEGRAGEPGEGL